MENRETLEGAARAVDTLLNESTLTFTATIQQDLSAALADDPYVDAGRIRVRVEPGTDWSLDLDRAAWLSNGVGIDAVYEHCLRLKIS